MRGMSKKRLYIVWYSHARRAETMARDVNAQVIYLYEARLKNRWLKPLRYLMQGWNTWKLLERERPSAVIVQTPPIFAPLVVVLWCWLRGRNRAAYVIDCHPGTFYDPNWHWALPLLRLLARGALTVTLCNEDAQYVIKQWNIASLFLPDGIPSMEPAVGNIGTSGEARVAVISTFSPDEPLDVLFQVARFLPKVTFYVTGNPQRAPFGLLAHTPENVVLTGFLRGGEYSALLDNVQGLLILTTLEQSLSCGAYEALAIAKPTLVSNTYEMRRCFPSGFIFADNTPEAIAQGVEILLGQQEQLTDAVIHMRDNFVARRRPRLEVLTLLLSSK